MRQQRKCVKKDKGVQKINEEYEIDVDLFAEPG